MVLVKLSPENCSSCKACLLSCSAIKFKVFNPKKGLLRIKDSIPFNRIFFCTQCGRCAEVCPVKAISKKGEVWLIDKNICTGCGICIKECPEQVMVMHKNKAWKCDLCRECVRHCTVRALI